MGRALSFYSTLPLGSSQSPLALGIKGHGVVRLWQGQSSEAVPRCFYVPAGPRLQINAPRGNGSGSARGWPPPQVATRFISAEARLQQRAHRDLAHGFV